MLTADEAKRDPLGRRQTYLRLADNSGWIFTDHPNPKDSRKLVSQVSMVDEKGALLLLYVKICTINAHVRRDVAH